MASGLDRRELIGAATLAATTVAMAASAQAQTPAPATGPYSIKPLPFAPNAIKGLSERILVSHHDNNYAGAVRRLNSIHAQFRALDVATAPVFTINGLKREELIAMNSMILHELYFDSLGAGGAPAGDLAQAIARDFGSVARWQAEFSAMGRAEGGGSGWVLLTWSPHDKRLINQWAADHTHGVAGGRPVLALDMYEHAYHMDYGSGAAGYVEAFMAAINWNNVSSLFARFSRES